MKVSKVIEMLKTYPDQDAEICASWWDKDLFDRSYEDAHEVPMPDDVWNRAVASFDEEQGFDFINSNMYELIEDFIDAPELPTD